MAKDKSDIPMYAWHEAAHSAVMLGWDIESDLHHFLQGKITVNPEDDSECQTNKFGVSLHISDWMEASKGAYTERFMEFWGGVYRNLKAQVDEGKQWPDVVLVSSHSGSSDYFTKEMLFDLLEVDHG